MTPTDILEVVRAVLRGAARGKTDRPWILSSYQVLDRLPVEIRDQLIAEGGGAGSGVGGNRSAAHIVAQALEMLERRGEATATYLDTGGVQFRVAGELVEGGYGPICKLYGYESPDRARGH
jgi:hypothetical protein